MVELKLASASGRDESASSLMQALVGMEQPLVAVLLEMLERAETALAVKDASSGLYVHVNARYAALFGHPPHDMLGKGDSELLPAAEAASMRVGEQAALTQTLPTVSEQRLERAGVRREFTVTRILLGGARPGAPRHLCAMWIDQSAARQRDARLRDALEQIERQQRTYETLRLEAQDAPSHNAADRNVQEAMFAEQLRREIDLSTRESRQFALVSIALDPAPDTVARHGAAARERILESLGSLIRSNTRAMDSSCRRGDDRFAVLLSGVGLATAHSRMEGLRRQCATQIVVLDGNDLNFSVAMGVASFPHTASSRDELLQAAESALADARRRGGNYVALAGIRFAPA